MAALDDVGSVALSVLRHRVGTNVAAEAGDRKSEDLVRELMTSRRGTEAGVPGPVSSVESENEKARANLARAFSLFDLLATMSG